MLYKPRFYLRFYNIKPKNKWKVKRVLKRGKNCFKHSINKMNERKKYKTNYLVSGKNNFKEKKMMIDRVIF